MADPDVRWHQRFDNFQRALQVLERGVELARQGIIGSRDATRLAFQNDLISDGEAALQDRFTALSQEPPT
jgi:hypothetical protein